MIALTNSYSREEKIKSKKEKVTKDESENRERKDYY